MCIRDSFVIASCALARDQEELAENALEACLRLDPAGVFADQAQELLETHPWLGYDCLLYTSRCV